MTLTPLHTREFESCFSFYKQSAIGTALSAANISKKLPYRTFAPPTADFPVALSDENYYGRGTNYPTRWDPIQHRIVIPSRQFDMCQFSAMFAAGFTMGAVSSSQPNSAGYNTVYDHKFTFQDAETNMECNYTSLIEEAGALWQKLIQGVVLEQFTIAGNPNDRVSIAWQGFGQKQVDDTTDPLPDVSAATFFNFRRSTVTFGAHGAGAAVSDAITAFTFTAMQNPNVRRNAGAEAGEETLISRVNVGKQRVNGSITLDKLDADTRNLFLNNSLCELTLVCIGELITGTPYYHTVTINIPHFKIPSETFGEDTDLTTYQIPFNDQTVLKVAGDDYCSVTVRTDISDSEILEAEV